MPRPTPPRQQIVQQINELQTYLENNDFRAEKAFDALLVRLNGTIDAGLLQRLESAMARLDAEQALKSLEQLKIILDHRLTQPHSKEIDA